MDSLTRETLAKDEYDLIILIKLHVNIRNLRSKNEPEPNRPRYILTELGVGYMGKEQTPRRKN